MPVSFASILCSVDGPRAVVGGVLARLQESERGFLWSTWVQEAHDSTWEECFVVGPRPRHAYRPELLVWVEYPLVVKALAA